MIYTPVKVNMSFYLTNIAPTSSSSLCPEAKKIEVEVNQAKQNT